MTSDVLSVHDAERLADCEARIERGLDTFVEVGRALLTIRDERLYRAEFGTFEAYCEQRWQFTHGRARHLIAAAEVTAVIQDQSDTAVSLSSERVARELAPLRSEPDTLRQVWTEAVERSNGNPTAAVVREVRDEHAVDSAVAEFPDLAHYRDKGDTASVTRLATALRGYDEPERSMRVDNLRKTIAAEQRRTLDPLPSPDYPSLASLIFVACNAATQAIARHGGTRTVAEAAAVVDGLESRTWQAEFTALADSCRALADACTPRLRSVK